ncbi:MAG: prenyltransferase, partial [Agromyces sp.]|nr:prenyltransferase [Agromyces sp.]
MMKTETVSQGSVHTATQVLLSSRPISWINTAFPFAAAYVLTTGAVDALLVVGTIFFLIPYNLLMYGVNDVFDYESDLR